MSLSRDGERADFWRSLGATPEETAQLLEYARSEFDLSRAPAAFPLPDEPFAAAWETYVEEAARVGAWPCLRERLVQLRFPIEAGISETPAYQAAIRRGVPPAPASPGLALTHADQLRLFLAETPVGRVPVILTASRHDFVALIRAFGHRSEPREILPSVGATIFGGLNNWDRVASLRRAWEAESPKGSPAAWAERWRDIVRQPELYQDRFIVLSSGPYSGASAADVGLGEEAWTEGSIALRLEHECTHYFTRRALGAMRNRLADELIADTMGIIAAAGRFRADWLLRFLGLERYPAFRPGGRLEEYRGDIPLDSGSFRLLCRAAHQCAHNLQAIDQLRPPWTRSAESSADKAEMILALASLGLEGLAGPAAVDAYLAARARAAAPAATLGNP